MHRVISIRQPFASLIALGIKTLENRTWPTSYRGPVLLHAGKRSEHKDPLVIEYCAARGIDLTKMEFQFGGIIGIANLNACIAHAGTGAAHHCSIIEHLGPKWKEALRWFEGPYAFSMVSGRELPFTPSRGRLSLYYPDDELIRQLNLK